jgi:hypothetical protein
MLNLPIWVPNKGNKSIGKTIRLELLSLLRENFGRIFIRFGISVFFNQTQYHVCIMGIKPRYS